MTKNPILFVPPYIPKSLGLRKWASSLYKGVAQIGILFIIMIAPHVIKPVNLSFYYSHTTLL